MVLPRLSDHKHNHARTHTQAIIILFLTWKIYWPPGRYLLGHAVKWGLVLQWYKSSRFTPTVASWTCGPWHRHSTFASDVSTPVLAASPCGGGTGWDCGRGNCAGSGWRWCGGAGDDTSSKPHLTEVQTSWHIVTKWSSNSGPYLACGAVWRNPRALDQLSPYCLCTVFLSVGN